MTEPISPISVHAPAAESMSRLQLHAPARAAMPASAGFGSGLREVTSALGDFSGRVFGREASGPAAMLASVERSALGSITPHDFLRTTLVATDLSMHVSISLMKFQLSSSLGSAATGLFNTLLKNRE